MYNLNYINGLLYASIILQEGEKSITIDDVIVDTGADHRQQTWGQGLVWQMK